MNPQQGSQQGAQQGAQQPPLQIPPVRQGYGRRPAHRSPPPPVRKRAAAYMAPARAAPRVRQDSLTTLPPPARAPAPAAAAPPAPAKDAWVRYVHVSGDAYWHNAATGESRWTAPEEAAAPAPAAPEPAPSPPRSPNNNRVAPKVVPVAPPTLAPAPSVAEIRAAYRREQAARRPAKPVVPPAPPSPVAWPAPSPPPTAVTASPPSPPTLTADPPTGATYRASRFAGCCWDARIRKWRANIQVKGYRIPLGDFEDEADAARAYDAARTKWKALMKSVKVPLNFPNSGIDEKTLAALPPLPASLRSELPPPPRRPNPPAVVLNARPPPRPSPEKGAFPRELFALVADDVDAALSNNLVAWSRDGQRVVFLEPQAFAEKVCPRVWNHNKWASLTKQLNIYGFRACGSCNSTEPASYEHEFFKKGRADLLSKVKRPSQDKPSTKNRGKRPFYGNQFTREVDNTAVLPELGAPLADAPHEAITESVFSDKPARLGGTHPARSEDDDPSSFKASRAIGDAACAAAFLKRGSRVKSAVADIASELISDDCSRREAVGRVLRYYYATFKASDKYPAAKAASRDEFEEEDASPGRGMRLRRRRERSESPEVAPTREKRIDPVNELRRALKNCRSMRECLDRLDTRTLRAVRNAATHLLDARLDDALAKPEPPPRKRARPPPEPRRRGAARYEPETPEQASRAAFEALRSKLRDRGQAGRDVLAGWTATRERSMRQDGTSNGFLYQFTDPDGEAFISLSAAARGALRRLSKSDSESEEEEEEPVQKHRLLGAEFDYHVAGLGWCRGRVAKVARGGLLEIHYKDLPYNAGRPQAAQRHLAAREVDASIQNSKPKGASYYVAPQRTFATGRRGSPGPKLEKPEIYKCGGCDRGFTTLSGRSNHYRYCEAGRAFAAAEAAARALAASDDDVASSASSPRATPTPPSSDSPRAVGTTKRFPCPAGCDRFFTHAPAAVQHGKTCAAKQKAARERAFAHEASPPPPFTSPPETPLADAEARVLSLAEGPPPADSPRSSPPVPLSQPTWWPSNSAS